ncbi:hypothetical protein [Herbidospora cretacea]|uniref:hypothetical protein n=1 Tax=Herbidospora cretacea TaxID=28444 RepID=UPI000B214CCA|nr:hypothetical protein [Herbidospora cretacea]
MKRRKVVQFYSSTTSETYIGDCPGWIALTRRARPDLRERRVIAYGGGPWLCWSCRPSH